MDKEPFIIKSGKGHSVEIEQGSTHARRKRNVILPQDEAAQEQRSVDEPLQQERKLAELGQQEHDVPGSLARDPQQDTQDVSSQRSWTAEEEGSLAPQESTPDAQAFAPDADAMPTPTPPDGPVLILEAPAEEDATASRSAIEADRYLSGESLQGAQRDARGPQQGALADRFVHDDSAALSDEDLRQAASPEQPVTNRQKVNSLQTRANRILIDQEQLPIPERSLQVNAVQGPAGDGADGQLPNEPALMQQPEAPLPQLAPVPGQVLPPELEGNLGFTPAAAQETPASALLARVRALRSNMSVTDDRLSKLQGKPPLKP